jgi:endonuclease YncB( thermonuclease family)
MYQYRATVVRVVDGDTVWLDVDLGFDVRRKDSFRLYGIDAPEMGTPEGVAAKAFLAGLLGQSSEVMVQTYKDRRERYGRYLASLWINDEDLNLKMIASGHAVEYFGGPR